MVAVNTWLSPQRPLRSCSARPFLGRLGSLRRRRSGSGCCPGSAAGHLLYLPGLCGMAAAAAVVRVAERRAPWSSGSASCRSPWPSRAALAPAAVTTSLLAALLVAVRTDRPLLVPCGAAVAPGGRHAPWQDSGHAVPVLHGVVVLAACAWSRTPRRPGRARWSPRRRTRGGAGPSCGSLVGLAVVLPVLALGGVRRRGAASRRRPLLPAAFEAVGYALAGAALGAALRAWRGQLDAGVPHHHRAARRWSWAPTGCRPAGRWSTPSRGVRRWCRPAPVVGAGAARPGRPHAGAARPGRPVKVRGRGRGR